MILYAMIASSQWHYSYWVQYKINLMGGSHEVVISGFFPMSYLASPKSQWIWRNSWNEDSKLPMYWSHHISSISWELPSHINLMGGSHELRVFRVFSIIILHSVWTPFHSMYENPTLCTNWFVHQANTTGAFIVHQAAGAFILHQGNVVEHFGSYIKAERSSPTMILGISKEPVNLGKLMSGDLWNLPMCIDE